MPTPNQPPFDELFAAIKIDASDPRAARQRIEMLELLLERSIQLPGFKRPIGLDAVLGLIPVVGDAISAALGAYIIWEARNLGMSKWKLTRMGLNVLVDTAIGAIPLVGDAADVLFRSNTKNLKLILKHIDKHHPEARVIEGQINR